MNLFSKSGVWCETYNHTKNGLGDDPIQSRLTNFQWLLFLQLKVAKKLQNRKYYQYGIQLTYHIRFVILHTA